MHASAEELSLCPGLGERKVKRLRECFLEPFVSRNAKTVAAADAQGNANAGDTAPNDGVTLPPLVDCLCVRGANYASTIANPDSGL
eukprot:6177467-Pleurochrysis_carterae.AAC.5